MTSVETIRVAIENAGFVIATAIIFHALIGLAK